MPEVANAIDDAQPLSQTEQDEKSDVDLIKQLRLEKEKKELLASLASGDFSTTKTRVAGVLNLYPHTRNSDVALALQYWEDFQPEVFKKDGILPKDLFKLERFHYLVRARAKIQNEYGLFQADEKIRRHRRVREEEMHEAVLTDAAPRRVLHIFADETGKTQNYVIVAAVWVLNGRSVFNITRAIQSWKDKSRWASREIHFAKFSRGDDEPLGEYLDIIDANREFLSFKIIAVEKARSKRSIEEIVQKLHEHMLTRGMEHEVSSNRVDLPREIEVILDQEQSLDPFVLADMKQQVCMVYQQHYGDSVSISKIDTVSSRHSPMVQLADVIAGAVNRRLNPQNERGPKDEMADMVIERLNLSFEGDVTVQGLDASALFRV